VLGTTAAAIWFRQREAPIVEEIRARFSIPDPPRLEMNFFQTAPAVSPDGRMLVFFASNGSSGSLWLRHLDSDEIRALPETEGALSAFWSPDGRSLAFFANDKLKRVPISGGPAQTICDSPDGSLGGCWNESGIIVFQLGPTGVLHQVQAAGGPSTPLFAAQSAKQSANPAVQQRPCFLPDGRTVLFTQVSTDPEKSGVYAVTLGSSEARRILPNIGAVRFVAPGHLLFGRDGKLTAQPFNASTLQPSGDAWVVATDVWTFQDVARFDVSASGIIAYSRVVPHTSRLT
jgi:dipeptidyl aminopeptidase/acylaminoacyl peptidase